MEFQVLFGDEKRFMEEEEAWLLIDLKGICADRRGKDKFVGSLLCKS